MWRRRVIAFEPSSRECRQLARHVRANRCKNVQAEACTVGDRHGEADLFLVDGFRDWGNSLRPAAVLEPTRRARVPVRKLDNLLEERGVEHVDFIKLDAEGRELAMLEGARRLLQGRRGRRFRRKPGPCERDRGDIRRASCSRLSGGTVDGLR
jgi:FkbM family methyltransferase